MKKILLALVTLASLHVAAPVFADNCVKRMSSPALNQYAPMFTVSAIWLQWLNRPYSFSCASISGGVRCSHGSERYETRDLWCNPQGNCGAVHYDVYGFRNNSSWTKQPNGSVWFFSFDNSGGQSPSGYLTYNPGSPELGVPEVYGTCFF